MNFPGKNLEKKFREKFWKRNWEKIFCQNFFLNFFSNFFPNFFFRIFSQIFFSKFSQIFFQNFFPIFFQIFFPKFFFNFFPIKFKTACGSIRWVSNRPREVPKFKDCSICSFKTPEKSYILPFYNCAQLVNFEAGNDTWSPYEYSMSV